MARRQKRKSPGSVASEQGTATDQSPPQTAGHKYIPKFKKARLKTTGDVVEHEQDALFSTDPNSNTENVPTSEAAEVDIPISLSFVMGSSDDTSQNRAIENNKDTLLLSSPPATGIGVQESTKPLSLPVTNILDDKQKDTLILQTPSDDAVTTNKPDIFQVVPIPTSDENDAVLPHTPQKVEIPPSDNQSLYEENTLLYKGDALSMINAIDPVETAVKLACGTDTVLPSRHNQTCKPSEGAPNEVISLNNADTVVPQVDDASTPSYSSHSSQELPGLNKLEAGTEMLQGLIEELSSLNRFIMCHKRELEAAKRQRNAWLKMQKRLNKEVR